MNKNIVNLSGGKDSTYMLYKLCEKEVRIDLLLFADVGEMAEFDEMYPYLARVERYFGIPIVTVKSKIHTARSMFYGYPSRGNHTDEIRGVPPTVGSGCRYRSWLKVDPLENYAGSGNNVFIGFAADEPNRCNSTEYAKGKQFYQFPLMSEKLTEADCLQGTKDIDLYNPLYDFFPRLGCWWCPKQSISSLRMLRKHFNDKWQQLLQMEEDQGRPFKHGYPAIELEKRFSEEDAGLRTINKPRVKNRIIIE